MKLVIILYLIVGIAYASSLIKNRKGTLLQFPVNVLAGPLFIIGVLYKTIFLRQHTNKFSYAVLKNKSVVLFDLDGTILDNQGLWYEAINSVLKSVQPAVIISENSIVGVPLENILKDIRQSYSLDVNLTDADIIGRINQKYIEIINSLPEVTPREGFMELITFLISVKKLKVGLVTNSERSIIDITLNKLGLDGVFDLTLAGSEVSHKKPSPDCYILAAKKLGASADRILIFEDSITGVAAATGAEMDTIVIWDKVIPIDKYPNYEKRIVGFYPDFEGILPLIKTDFATEFENLKKDAAENEEFYQEMSTKI